MDLDIIQAKREEQRRLEERGSDQSLIMAVDKSVQELKEASQVSSKLQVTLLKGQADKLETLAKSKDVDKLADSVDTLVIGEHVSQNKVITQLEDLNETLKKLPQEYPELPDFPEIPVPPDEVSVKNLKEVTDWLKKVVGAIGKIQVSPVVNVEAPQIEAPQIKVDAPNLEPLLKAIEKIDVKPEVTIPDNQKSFEALQRAVSEVNKSIRSIQFPVPNYVIPFSKDGKGTQVVLDSQGRLPVSQGLTAGVDYNYLDVQQTDADTETYVFKTGGSGGTTVRTIVVNYTDSTKGDIDNVSWA